MTTTRQRTRLTNQYTHTSETLLHNSIYEFLTCGKRHKQTRPMIRYTVWLGLNHSIFVIGKIIHVFKTLKPALRCPYRTEIRYYRPRNKHFELVDLHQTPTTDLRRPPKKSVCRLRTRPYYFFDLSNPFDSLS